VASVYCKIYDFVSGVNLQSDTTNLSDEKRVFGHPLHFKSHAELDRNDM